MRHTALGFSCPAPSVPLCETPPDDSQTAGKCSHHPTVVGRRAFADNLPTQQLHLNGHWKILAQRPQESAFALKSVCKSQDVILDL